MFSFKMITYTRKYEYELIICQHRQEKINTVQLNPLFEFSSKCIIQSEYVSYNASCMIRIPYGTKSMDTENLN